MCRPSASGRERERERERERARASDIFLRHVEIMQLQEPCASKVIRALACAHREMAPSKRQQQQLLCENKPHVHQAQNQCQFLPCKRKAHDLNINFLVRLCLKRPRVCPRDKPSLSLGHTEGFSFLYTVETQCLLGTNQVKRRQKSSSAKSLCVFFAP